MPLIVSGLTIGVAYTALPGPVNTEATRRGLSHGFGPALTIQLGSLVGDVLWAILGLTGAVLVLQRDSLAVALGVIGAGFLFALARTAFKGALEGASASGTATPGNGWKLGILFSLANPAGIAFWSGVGGGMLGTAASPGMANAVAILASYVASSALCGVLFAMLAALGRKYATGPVMRWIDGVCGVALTWFGVRLLWSTIRRAHRWIAPLRVAIA